MNDPYVRLLSVDEYHRLIQAGILTEDDSVELLEGYVVQKEPHTPPHDSQITGVDDAIYDLLPPEWARRLRCCVTLPDSEPEPDVAIVLARPDDYYSHHPGPEEIGMVVEVADLFLECDRNIKSRIYARAGIPIYWIVNVPDRQIEVYTQPSGPTANPAYAQRQDYRPGDQIPFVLNAALIAMLDVSEILG